MKKSLIFAVITALVFVTLEPVSKLIAADVNPYAITFWRFLLASLFLMPLAILKIKRESLHITLKEIGIMLLLGILFICVSMPALQLSVEIAASPALIAIIFSSNSIFSILFAAILTNEKVTLQKACAIIFCIIGVLICVDFNSNVNIESILLSVFSAASFSLYSVLSGKYKTKLGNAVQTSIVFFLGSLVLLAVLLTVNIPIIPPIDFINILILTYLGLIVTGVGYFCYFRAIEKGSTVMGSLAFFIKPILTPFVTFAINGIVPDFKIFVAILFIVVGSYIVVYKKGEKQK